MIITIDGPSGTGKTTIARHLATRLKFVYFDTGAMYRALTWYALEQNVDIQNLEALEQLLARFSFNIEEKGGQKRYFVHSVDVTEAIRSPVVTAHVSAVAAQKKVREALLGLQHQFAKNKNAVFEGRDLGTVVFPQAELKIFLTADPEIRAERRLLEFMEKSPDTAFDKQAVLKDIKQRDTLDSEREVAPLKCPEGAHRIDTSFLSVEQIVEEIATYVKTPHGKKGGVFYRLIIFIVRLFFALLYRHKVYGVDHFCAGGAIVAPNHVSNFDPPLVAISAPEEVHFLAKEELFTNFLFGKLIRSLNAHPVKGSAGDIAVLKMICGLLNEGKKILLFPEGKRAERDELDPLKPGIALLVARSKTAVIPTYVHGTFAAWNRSRRFPKLWGKTACVFGTPIYYSTFEHLDKREAQEQFTKRLASAILQLREWYLNGASGEPP